MKLSPPIGSSRSSGRGSPVRTRDAAGTGQTYGGASAGDRTSNSSQGEPAENWKRAAEVTSQLKARIEQMKVRSHLYEFF